MPCDAIGMTITEAFQVVSEQSTVALVVHHPEATYFFALSRPKELETLVREFACVSFLRGVV